jgi:hypothetical protein
MFPDLVLTSAGKGKRLEGIVEVETAESVNHLEAMAQWAHFGRARAPFHLYVPAATVDIARRLCIENDVAVSEIWSYHTIADQTRFTLVHRTNAPRSAAAKSNGNGKSNGSNGGRAARGESAKKPRPAASARKSKTKKPASRARR